MCGWVFNKFSPSGHNQITPTLRFLSLKDKMHNSLPFNNSNDKR